jgi:hypothetical protein
MKMPPLARKIIWLEVVAFSSIILIAWVNELGLEQYFLGGSHTPDWRDPILETIGTLAVSIPTVLFSWRVTKRLHYLEEFVRVCAWCHKVGQDNDWIPVEDFIKKTFNTETTHGICPSCSRKLHQIRYRVDT